MYLAITTLSFLVTISLVLKRLHQFIRLSHVPGPFWAKLTNIWRYFACNAWGYAFRLVDLHEKYGKLVRIGPNHISISDPDAIPIVYGTNPVWKKGPSYYGAVTVSCGRAVPSIIAMSESQHSAVRKTVGGAFTTNSLLDYEPYIEESSAELIRILKEKPIIDIGLWLQFYAMDVLMRIAFSDSPGFMDKGSDVDGILYAVMDRFDHWGRWGAMPGMDYLLNKSYWATNFKASQDSPLARVSRSRFNARKKAFNQEILKDLCQKFIQGHEKHPDALNSDEILGIILSTIGAGADTTAGTLTYTLVFLSQHPASRTRLQAEIDDGLREGVLSSHPTWSEVNSMPYLDAVLKESMRLLPVASWGLDRVVPDTGATISGKFIPPGTVVGCHIDAVHLNQEVYGKDAESFRPERWLEASDEQKRRMDRSFLAFSAGKRICTGKNIAWLEMKKLLPLLLMYFEVWYLFKTLTMGMY